jgi:hypothetical protein
VDTTFTVKGPAERSFPAENMVSLFERENQNSRDRSPKKLGDRHFGRMLALKVLGRDESATDQIGLVRGEF